MWGGKKSYIKGKVTYQAYKNKTTKTNRKMWISMRVIFKNLSVFVWKHSLVLLQKRNIY